MDDVRIGDLLFTSKCDIEGMDVITIDQKPLGMVSFQVVDIAAYTVRYIGVEAVKNIYLIPAELILDVDENGLIMDFDANVSAKLLPLLENWQESFARAFEEKIYSTLNLIPYWQ